MADVLVRNVPDDVLDVIRSTAARNGESLQVRLSRILADWVTYQRRHEALRRTAARLAGRPDLPDEARRVAIDQFWHDVEERGGERAGPAEHPDDTAGPVASS